MQCQVRLAPCSLQFLRSEHPVGGTKIRPSTEINYRDDFEKLRGREVLWRLTDAKLRTREFPAERLHYCDPFGCRRMRTEIRAERRRIRSTLFDSLQQRDGPRRLVARSRSQAQPQFIRL